MVSIRSALVAIVLSSIFDSVHSSCGHGTSLLKRQTHMKRQEGGAAQKVVEVGKFGYLGSDGPTQWASLSPEFTGCATNTIQSPIDITNQSTVAVAGSTLTIEFPDTATAEFENVGTTVEVVMEGKGAKTTIAGKEFELKQFHFHSPSEHTIDGEYFPLEMHMVHEAADASIAVLAVHFQLSENGETTELVKGIMDKIDAISTAGTVTEVGPLVFTPVVDALKAQNLHQYTGSLTTPPCAEGLTFLVTSVQLPLDVATFNKVKAVVGFNSRFIQNTPLTPNLLSLSSAAVSGLAGAGGAVAQPAEAIAEAPSAEGAVASGVPTLTLAPPAATSAAVVAEGAEAAKSAGGASVETVSGNSGNAAEIVKGLTGLDLGAILGQVSRDV